jgi:hypothetical protein
MRQAFMALSLVLTLFAASPAASKLAPSSGVYCIESQNTLELFDFRSLTRGRIQFGLTLYDPEGHSMHVYGVAIPKGRHAWVYRADLNNADSRCIVHIRQARDTMIVTGDEAAPCNENGGYGTSVGSHRFSRRYFEKPVTWEFANEEVALEHAGHCWRRKPNARRSDIGHWQ